MIKNSGVNLADDNMLGGTDLGKMITAINQIKQKYQLAIIFSHW